MSWKSTNIDEVSLRRSLTTPKIVFVVVGAAAPLAAMVGTVPLAFAIGNGAGVPAGFLFAGVTLLCFSVGYAAMSRRIVSTGGFYTYLARGLGRPPAVAGGLIAVLSYNALAIGIVGAFGYFAQLVAGSHGLHLPWPVWSGLAIVAMVLLGYRQIDMSARVLGVLTAAEIGILTALFVSILISKGGGALPATAMAPATVLGPGLGIALMFAFMSFTGFESAANYGEETHDPRRSVPLATYTSVLVIAAFYTLVSWSAVGAVGAANVVATSHEQLGDLFFVLSEQYLGEAATTVLQILVCTSLFGAILAMHNAANRYTYVLGRERVLPGWLGAVHRSHGSPARASLAHTGLTVVVVAIFALAGLDPYVNLATSMLGVGTLAIVVLQASAAASVLGFFHARSDRHWWRTGLAPLLGLIGLTGAAVLMVANFSIVTGTESAVVNLLPWLVVLAAVGGTAYGLWMRAARPDRYAGLAVTVDRDATSTPVAAGPPARPRPTHRDSPTPAPPAGG